MARKKGKRPRTEPWGTPNHYSLTPAMITRRKNYWWLFSSSEQRTCLRFSGISKTLRKDLEKSSLLGGLVLFYLLTQRPSIWLCMTDLEHHDLFLKNRKVPDTSNQLCYIDRKWFEEYFIGCSLILECMRAEEGDQCWLSIHPGGRRGGVWHC